MLSLLVALGVAQGCASLSSRDEAPVVQPNLTDGGAAKADFPDGGAAVPADAAVGSNLNPLCGLAGRCYGNAPDDPNACTRADAGLGTSAGGAPGTEAGVPTDGRPDAARVPDATAEGGSVRDGAAVPLADGGADVGADVGADDSGSPSLPALPGDRDGGGLGHRPSGATAPPAYTPTPEVDAGAVFSCQVRPADNGRPIHECVPAGIGEVSSPCTGAHDCRAGLVCVGGSGAGQCQQYCCEMPAKCAPLHRPDGGTTPMYCTDRPLLEGHGATALRVPVCALAEQCHLDCVGDACTCPKDTTCAVVLPDGTTGCVSPGKGRGGDPCPTGACASGYFCSAAKLCIKTCKPGVTDATCDPGKCQAAAGLPDGFGLCVSASPAAR